MTSDFVDTICFLERFAIGCSCLQSLLVLPLCSLSFVNFHGELASKSGRFTQKQCFFFSDSRLYTVYTINHYHRHMYNVYIYMNTYCKYIWVKLMIFQ